MSVVEPHPNRDRHVWSEVNLDQMHKLYTLRSHVEGFAAKQAAQRVLAGDSPKELDKCYQQMLKAARLHDYEAFFEADMAFHRAIAGLAQTPGLTQVWDTLSTTGREFAMWSHKSGTARP